MDYTTIKKMIEDKAPDIKPFTYDCALSPGVVFVPPLQIDDWKSSYLVIGEKDNFCTCIRTSFHDEKCAGSYDLIDNNIIFETWNAILIPLTDDIKGYKKIRDDVLNSVIQVREAWLSDELPDASFCTGKNIDSDPDRRLFHEAELQANESLQNALLSGTTQFSSATLWEKTGISINITPHFEGLESEGQLSALLGHLSLSLIWESTSGSLPPVATIREIASNTFSIVHWEPLEDHNSFQFMSHVPESVNSMILNVEGMELKLEVLPSVDKNIVCEHSPLSLILFYIYKEIQLDPYCMIPDDLLDFGFGSLEQKAIQAHMNLKLIADKIGFLLLLGLFCEGTSEFIKLGVFKWIETNIKNINAFEPENNFQQFSLKLLNWQKQGYRESIQWFYKNSYDVWSDILRQYKNWVDPSVVLTEDDVEHQVGKMMGRWSSEENLSLRLLRLSKDSYQYQDENINELLHTLAFRQFTTEEDVIETYFTFAFCLPDSFGLNDDEKLNIFINIEKSFKTISHSQLRYNSLAEKLYLWYNNKLSDSLIMQTTYENLKELSKKEVLNWLINQNISLQDAIKFSVQRVLSVFHNQNTTHIPLFLISLVSLIALKSPKKQTASSEAEVESLVLLDEGDVKITYGWRSGYGNRPTCFNIQWKANINEKMELVAKFINPDVPPDNPEHIRKEINLGSWLVGEESFTSEQLGFDPTNEKWAIAFILVKE